MTSRTPSSQFEKAPVAKAIEIAYPSSVRAEVAKLVETHASPEIIRSHLIEHVAHVNPTLAEEIMKAPTEGLVLKTIGNIVNASTTNNSVFTAEASNDRNYREAA